MATRIEYRTEYEAQTGIVSLLTSCPHRTGVPAECIRCKYFVAILFKEQVECAKPVESVFLAPDGLSEPQPCNLSFTKGKPLQTKIQFE